MVAVKRLKQSALTNKGKKDFAREVAVMAGLHHGSLLRLLAYCNEGNERILVYAYMKNKSLDNHIFGPLPRRANLHWRRRLDIIQAIAKGVAYLHEGPDGSVIHRDLKLSNILLDDELKPKIADFGTAKLFVADQSGQTLVVSQGYASPEYALRDEMTLKCDVYSFGVVLLETLSGVRNGSMQTLLPQVIKQCTEHIKSSLQDNGIWILQLDLFRAYRHGGCGNRATSWTSLTRQWRGLHPTMQSSCTI
jgi:serine/threonine protein kinase